MLTFPMARRAGAGKIFGKIFARRRRVSDVCVQNCVRCMLQNNPIYLRDSPASKYGGGGYTITISQALTRDEYVLSPDCVATKSR